MTLKNLTDHKLLLETKNARSIEKLKIHQVLLHLKEILNRKLFADLNYGSLHEYCMRELGYTSGEAAYRVSAVKLMGESKKIELKIKTGELNLSNAVLVHNHFSGKEIRPTVKELENTVDQVCGKSKSQAKEVLKEEIEKSKEKLIQSSQKKSNDKNSRYIPKAVKAKVLLRSKGVCESPGCKRKNGTEFEHVIPFSRGGKNTEENIKLFCRLHNQRAAVKCFGVKKMNQYAFQLCHQNGEPTELIN